MLSIYGVKQQRQQQVVCPFPAEREEGTTGLLISVVGVPTEITNLSIVARSRMVRTASSRSRFELLIISSGRGASDRTIVPASINSKIAFRGQTL